MKLTSISIVSILLMSGSVIAHPGETDEKGGHYEEPYVSTAIQSCDQWISEIEQSDQPQVDYLIESRSVCASMRDILTATRDVRWQTRLASGMTAQAVETRCNIIHENFRHKKNREQSEIQETEREIQRNQEKIHKTRGEIATNQQEIESNEAQLEGPQQTRLARFLNNGSRKLTPERVALARLRTKRVDLDAELQASHRRFDAARSKLAEMKSRADFYKSLAGSAEQICHNFKNMVEHEGPLGTQSVIGRGYHLHTIDPQDDPGSGHGSQR